MGVGNGRLDFPLAIGVPDATGQRHGVVVPEHVAVERVQRGIVEVRGEDALLQIVQNHDPDGAAEPAERLFVQLGPPARARGEGQQADALAAVAQGEHEQARAAVLAGDGVPHHRTVGVIHLAFLSGRRDDHGMRVGGPLPAQLHDEAADARVLGGKAVIVDEVAPDRHGVAPASERGLDEFTVRLARAGGRGAARRRPLQRARDPRRELPGVGGHPTGRIWRRQSAVPGISDGDPGRLEVDAGRLAPHPGGLLDAAKRPA